MNPNNILDLDQLPKNSICFQSEFFDHRAGGLTGTILLNLKEIELVQPELEDIVPVTLNCLQVYCGDNKLFNSNLLEFLLKNQNRIDVKEFLDLHKDKVLYAFGDIFYNKHASYFVRGIFYINNGWQLGSFQIWPDELSEFGAILTLSKNAIPSFVE